MRHKIYYTAASGGATAACVVLGYVMRGAGNSDMDAYRSEADTERATSLGDDIRSKKEIANTLLIVGEGTLFLTGALGAWLVFDFLKYRKSKVEPIRNSTAARKAEAEFTGTGLAVRLKLVVVMAAACAVRPKGVCANAYVPRNGVCKPS